MLDWGRPVGFGWAEQFNDEGKRRILAGEHQELADWHMLGAESRAALEPFHDSDGIQLHDLPPARRLMQGVFST